MVESLPRSLHDLGEVNDAYFQRRCRLKFFSHMVPCYRKFGINSFSDVVSDKTMFTDDGRQTGDGRTTTDDRRRTPA